LANPSKFVLMTYSQRGDLWAAGCMSPLSGLVVWGFGGVWLHSLAILYYFGVPGWRRNFSPTARSIVLFQLTFYFCFLFVFPSSCWWDGDEDGDETETETETQAEAEAGHAWHSAWVAHYLMMLFAIFSHLSAWFLLVEFFTVSPAKVSVSYCFFFFFFLSFFFVSICYSLV